MQNLSRWGFALGNTPNVRILRWYLKTLIFALPPTRTLKFAEPPTRTPNAGRWNIGCVRGPQREGLALAMYISCCLCNFFRVGYAKIILHDGCFWWNTGLRISCLILYLCPPNFQNLYNIFKCREICLNFFFIKGLVLILCQKWVTSSQTFIFNMSIT